MLRKLLLGAGFGALIAIGHGPATLLAQQSDAAAALDEATRLKLDAKTPDQLAKVIGLCEQALAAELDAADQAFAKELLASSSFERAKLVLQQLSQGRMTPNTLRQIRESVIVDLERTVTNSPQQAEAYFVLAQLYLRLEEVDKARGTIDRAVSNLQPAEGTAQREALAQALLLRARISADPQEQLADIQRAIEADPANTEAWQLRVALLIGQGRFEDALAALQQMLAADPTNLFAIQGAVESLLQMERAEEAIDLISQSLEKTPDASLLYRLRGQLRMEADQSEEALEDLDRAVELDPSDPAALLLRGQAHLTLDNLEQADKDLNDALLMEPGLVRGIIMRSVVRAQQGRFDEAIEDLQKLVRVDPRNTALLIQLSGYYQMAGRNSMALKILDQALLVDPQSTTAMATKADVLLSLGRHTEAIEQYRRLLEQGLEGEPERSRVLNNYAWVLSTSPYDHLRDGQRAIVLATEACELTEYQASHILSTLAAAYAEAGQFDKAVQWASKAAELGKEKGSEQLEQLREELDSYQRGEPWREKQEAGEQDAVPLIPAGAGIDT